MPKIRKHLFEGELLTLPEIIIKTQCTIPYQTIASRLKRGKEIEVAVSRPSRKYIIQSPSKEWLKLRRKENGIR